jgi:hypothetical protein
MYEQLFILWMGFLSRAAGGGFGASYLDKEKGLNLSMLPELLFGLSLGIAYMIIFKNPYIAGIVSIWCYAWMETGHGTVLQWGDNPSAARGLRRQTLTPVVEWFSDRLGFYYGGINYCRLFMFVKGFLIGLPFGGLPLAVLWTLSYETGHRLQRNEVSEILCGVSTAFSVFIFYSVF